MALVLNTNVAALNGARNLAKTQDAQSQTFNRLSTGLRINSAKDDAAGLYLAQSQTKDIRGLSMATRNAGDGISMAQTAEGALDQIQSNLQRINELAIQSANGTYSAEARGGLQKEVDQLTQEVNRIVETTEFNGQKLLSSDAKSETLQIGFKNDSGSRITTGLDGGIESLESLKNVTFFGAGQDFQNITVTDGKTDNANVRKAFGETLGLTMLVADATDPLADATIGSKLAGQIQSAFSDIQGDAETFEEALGAKFGNGAVQADLTETFTAGGIDFTLKFSLDGDNELTAATLTANYAGTEFQVGANNAFNDTAVLKGDANADAFATAVAGLGVGSAGNGTNGAISIKVSDSNALNAIIAGDLTQTKAVDITTQKAAQNAITQTRTAIDLVSEIRAEFGANMNRFEAVISGNQTYSENLSAARSRVQDADFAAETSNLAKQQVLQQAGVAALGQANASSQVVLGLL